VASESKMSRNKPTYDWNNVAKLSREQEVKELSKNNSSLCKYIETVRQLTQENSKLVEIVTTLNVSREKENTEIENLYKDKLENLRQEKEEMKKKVDQMRIETDVLNMLNIELKNKNKKAQTMLNENEVKLNLAKNEKTYQKDLLQSSEGFLKKLTCLLTESQSKQDVLINSVQSTANDVQKLKNQVEELTKAKNQKQVKIGDHPNEVIKTKKIIEAIEKEKVDPATVFALNDLYKILDDLRAKKEEDKDTTLDETLKELSDVRLLEWNKLADIEQSMKLLEKHEKKIENLLREEQVLKDKIDSHKENFDLSKEKHQEDMNKKDLEIQNLEERMEKVKKMIDELFEIKSSLDAEIKIYKALLDSESDPIENIGKEIKTSKYTEETLKISKGRKSACLDQPNFSFVAESKKDEVQVKQM